MAFYSGVDDMLWSFFRIEGVVQFFLRTGIGSEVPSFRRGEIPKLYSCVEGGYRSFLPLSRMVEIEVFIYMRSAQLRVHIWEIAVVWVVYRY